MEMLAYLVKHKSKITGQKYRIPARYSINLTFDSPNKINKLQNDKYFLKYNKINKLSITE